MGARDPQSVRPPGAESRRSWLCRVLLLGGLLVPVPGLFAADPRVASADELKAAFVFNFSKFVTWPADTFAGRKGTLVIGVLGDPAMGQELERLVRGKTVDGRAVEVETAGSLAGLGRCDLIFVSQSEDRRVEDVVRELRGRPVLTVGESDRFADAGGMICLRWEGNRLRFEVNMDAAEAAQLKISAQLLRLARKVFRGGRWISS